MSAVTAGEKSHLFEQTLNSPKFSRRYPGLTTFLFAEASR
jgi:hypothetical protein